MKRPQRLQDDPDWGLRRRLQRIRLEILAENPLDLCERIHRVQLFPEVGGVVQPLHVPAAMFVSWLRGNADIPSDPVVRDFHRIEEIVEQYLARMNRRKLSISHNGFLAIVHDLNIIGVAVLPSEAATDVMRGLTDLRA